MTSTTFFVVEIISFFYFHFILGGLFMLIKFLIIISLILIGILANYSGKLITYYSYRYDLLGMFVGPSLILSHNQLYTLPISRILP